MLNASYLAQILDIDYNRCYKFAMKNPKLTQEELLELYFLDTKALVWDDFWMNIFEVAYFLSIWENMNKLSWIFINIYERSKLYKNGMK